MMNLLVGDHQVAVVDVDEVVVDDVDEGVLEVSDMSGTRLNGFLKQLKIVKI